MVLVATVTVVDAVAKAVPVVPAAAILVVRKVNQDAADRKVRPDSIQAPACFREHCRGYFYT